MQHALGFVVVGFELGEPERPAKALERGIGVELVRGEAQQRRAVPFGLAAEIIMLAGRDERPSMPVLPFGLVGEAPLLEHDCVRQSRRIERQAVPFLDHQHTLARFDQLVGRSGAAGAAADHDDVESVRHRLLVLIRLRAAGSRNRCSA